MIGRITPNPPETEIRTHRNFSSAVRGITAQSRAATEIIKVKTLKARVPTLSRAVTRLW
jgi:hypothetical protein